MIAVIADDLTGAAELGGLGLRFNLNVEIVTEVDQGTTAELLIVSADTRSVNELEAVSRIRQITRKLLELNPDLIYKKIDSVLRGHVVAELKAQMEVMEIRRALIVPSNPDLGRTIENGQYCFRGQPIHLSSFANDPEFPVRSSSVTDMLGTREISIVKQADRLAGSGISVGEVTANSDFGFWAGLNSSDIVLAGAASFFSALLDKLSLQGKGLGEMQGNQPHTPTLFVSGTTFNKSRQDIKALKLKGGPVSYMPSSREYDDCSNEIVDFLNSSGKAILAIEETPAGRQFTASELRAKSAEIVQKVMQKVSIRELVVEGGSTAASIIRKLGITRLIPVKELTAGVIRMKADGLEGLFLTIKPGSYGWPEGLWLDQD